MNDYIVKSGLDDGLYPPKSQYHKILYEIGDALAEAFNGRIIEVPNEKIAGVSSVDKKFLNALQRIKQAIKTAEVSMGGGGSSGAQEPINAGGDDVLLAAPEETGKQPRTKKLNELSLPYIKEIMGTNNYVSLRCQAKQGHFRIYAEPDGKQGFILFAAQTDSDRGTEIRFNPAGAVNKLEIITIRNDNRLILTQDPVDTLEAVTKRYVDNIVINKPAKQNGTVTVGLNNAWDGLLYKAGGWAHLIGYMTVAGTIADARVLLTVPEGFRPDKLMRPNAIGANGSLGRMNFDTNGQLAMQYYSSGWSAQQYKIDTTFFVGV